MKKIILSILVILLCSLIHAQTDPTWLWAKWGGSVNVDSGRGIARDSAGNIYITGWFKGTVEFGDLSLTSTEPGNCVFVAKLDSDGNWLWARQGSGTGSVQGYGIASDSGGNCTVTGEFSGSVTFGGSTIISENSAAIFAAKIDNTGNWLWAVAATGNEYGDDKAYAVTIGEMGNSYITGYFKGTAIFGMDTLTSYSGDVSAVFVAKLDAGGNWVWATKAGGTSWDNATTGFGIAADSEGTVYVTGNFSATVSFGDITLISAGGVDIFVAELSAAGGWNWAKRAGGNSTDTGLGISCDNSGNCYVTGYFNNTADFGTITLTATSGQADVYIAKITNLHDWIWARKAAGSGTDQGRSIATDENGNNYITGDFIDTATFGTTTLNSSNMYASDIYAAKLDSDGNWLWAKRAGGNGEDIGFAITSDNNGNCYVAGMTTGNADFDAFTITGTGSQDIFAAKLSSGIVDSIDDTNPSASDVSRIINVFPNPCRAGKTIQFKLNIADNEKGTLTVYNVRGQSIAKYSLNSGEQNVLMDNIQLSSGIYFYQLTTNNKSLVRKLLLLK